MCWSTPFRPGTLTQIGTERSWTFPVNDRIVPAGWSGVKSKIKVFGLRPLGATMFPLRLNAVRALKRAALPCVFLFMIGHAAAQTPPRPQPPQPPGQGNAGRQTSADPGGRGGA